MSKRKKGEETSSDAEVEGADSIKKLKLESEGEEFPALEEKNLDHREKLELLISSFSNSQQDQYEIFRRSTFPKSSVRKIMQTVCGGTVPQNAVIAMAGITKVFVGEIVDEACQARENAGEDGPLQPKHIREAVRRLKNKDKMPNTKYKKVFPIR